MISHIDLMSQIDTTLHMNITSNIDLISQIDLMSKIDTTLHMNMISQMT